MEFRSGLAAPAKTPAPIVRAIHDATVKALIYRSPVNVAEIRYGIIGPISDPAAFGNPHSLCYIGVIDALINS